MRMLLNQELDNMVNEFDCRDSICSFVQDLHKSELNQKRRRTKRISAQSVKYCSCEFGYINFERENRLFGILRLSRD